MQHIDTRAMIQLKAAKDRLSPQQYRTLRGQVLAGDPDGAMKGLRNILQRRADRQKGSKNGLENHILVQ